MAITNDMARMEQSGHPNWADRAIMTLGIAVFLSSLFHPVPDGLAAALNTMITGGVIAGLGVMQMLFLRPWEEFLVFLAGVWTILSPYAIGYSDPLRPWHVGFGLIVALLAATQMWQDRNRRFAESPRFGRW